MAAYVVVEVEVTDPVRYEEYRKTVLPTLVAYGGRFLVRGGKLEVLEGSWLPKRLVIIEFPDVATAKAWWASAEYANPKAIRQSASHTEMIVVQGAS
jgi:uncharacterized protein (DUF1330 family)